MKKQANALVVLWDGGGVVPPIMSVARRMVEHGYEVFALADPTVREEAEAAGCTFLPLVEAPHRTTRAREQDILTDYAIANKLKFFQDTFGGYFYRSGGGWMRDILRAIDEHDIGLVVSDSIVPWGLAAAELRGLPCVALSTTVYAIPSPGMVPPGAVMMRVPAFASRPRDALLRWAIEWMYDKLLADLNRVRQSHGLAPLDHTLDQVRRADAILVLTAAAFDYGGAGAPDNVHWVGPQLADPSWAEEWSSPWEDDDPRPLVVVGLSSTFQDQVHVLKRLVQVLSALPVRGLVTLGPALEAGELEGSANTVVVRSVPHARVLPETAVLVTHCGHGTAIKGLASGLPMLCIPMGRDQDDNAGRVVAMGAGLSMSPKASVEQLRAGVERLLSEPGFRRAAGEVADAIARREGDRDLLDILDSIM